MKPKIRLSNLQGMGDAVMVSALVEGLHQAGHEVALRMWGEALALYTADPRISPIDPPGEMVELFVKGWDKPQHLIKTLADQVPYAFSCKPVPKLYLTTEEEVSPYAEPYIVLSSSAKTADCEVKAYPWWDEVGALLSKSFKVVNVGCVGQHFAAPLVAGEDLRGKTDVRGLMRLVRHAAGVVSPISLPMHLAAAWCVPTVVIAGGFESPEATAYPRQKRLGVTLPCTGCKVRKLIDCQRPSQGTGACMMVDPKKVAEEMLRLVEA